MDGGYEDLKVQKLVSRAFGSRATTPYGEQRMEIELDSKVPANVGVKKVPSFMR